MATSVPTDLGLDQMLGTTWNYRYEIYDSVNNKVSMNHDISTKAGEDPLPIVLTIPKLAPYTPLVRNISNT